MCGHYTRNLTWGEIVDLYWLTLPAEAPMQVKPNYNVAPTQQLPIVRPHGEVRDGVIAGWGLIPFWMKDLQRGDFAAESVCAYHERMPVVLREDQFDAWMRGTPDEAAELLVPYSGPIEAWQVGKAVSSPKNTRPR